MDRLAWESDGVVLLNRVKPHTDFSGKIESGILKMIAVGMMCGVATLGAQNKDQGKLAECGVVMEEILNVPENIPRDLLDKAECVVVIPSMTTVALGIGGNWGHGAMVCRGGSSFTGRWGAPGMYSIDGGSLGFQIGAESTDVVLLVMNRRGVDALLSTKVKLGADASVAAGPKGRTLGASTDASMRAEILSYSRSRGVFAGIALTGSSLRPNNDANEQVYGRKLTTREIVTGRGIAVPESGHRLVDVLQRNSPTNESSTPKKHYPHREGRLRLAESALAIIRTGRSLLSSEQ